MHAHLRRRPHDDEPSPIGTDVLPDLESGPADPYLLWVSSSPVMWNYDAAAAEADPRQP